jgi:hypothetical protein
MRFFETKFLEAVDDFISQLTKDNQKNLLQY